jgi:hypothetical protein
MENPCHHGKSLIEDVVPWRNHGLRTPFPNGPLSLRLDLDIAVMDQLNESSDGAGIHL